MGRPGASLWKRREPLPVVGTGESRHKGQARDTGQQPDGTQPGGGGPESRPWSMGTPGHSLAAVHLHGVPSSCHHALLPGSPPGQHRSLRGTRTPALHTSALAEASFPQQLFKEVTKQGVSSVGTQAPPTFLRVNKETAKWSPLQGRQRGPSITIRHFYFRATSDPSWADSSPLAHPLLSPPQLDLACPDVCFNLIIKEECQVNSSSLFQTLERAGKM